MPPLVLIALFVMAPTASPNSFDLGYSLGMGIVTGPDEEMLHSLAGTVPQIVSVGYSFGIFKLSAEGLFGFPLENHKYDIVGYMWMFSLVNTLDFFSHRPLRLYALLGIGYGYATFSPHYETTSGTGPYQLQAGFGISFEVMKRLELGTETRIRIGFPNHPDVVTLYQQFFILLRFGN